MAEEDERVGDIMGMEDKEDRVDREDRVHEGRIGEGLR
eukprot:CAMPEP_0204916818 /NCGR_PEP_ID=MMETSP1397-20131031/14549_1 /ASSEMBLY_ACC=CAM_ASM_000891 /TAXON_ID=49980 /ORGANISM="Climacostomum Climacostomum virens, Strain Stock W-24" /LENGTH=37 /DNA_ID= /DNA_START= /DNA_END= /DNA_ORIENTATION=